MTSDRAPRGSAAPGATHSPIRDSGEHAAPEKPAEGLSGVPHRVRMRLALLACLKLDDATARAHLTDLDIDQLKAVEGAALALSQHARRIRTAREEGT